MTHQSEIHWSTILIIPHGVSFCSSQQDLVGQLLGRTLCKDLGAVITQNGRPVAYASRALSATERNYAQIEKECLAIVFATQRFEQYILGRDNVVVLSDHQPLMSIFKKPILVSPKTFATYATSPTEVLSTRRVQAGFADVLE